ncbi:MAG TPA: hypothetical protein VLX91_08355 [Candidatus Acidoferrales bacterium]|nr:hypothetical protein [Candidatus Acidoferrales bacterium]
MIRFLNYILPRGRMLLLLIAFTVSPAVAQKINFGAYTTSAGLNLYPSAGLNFNDKQPAILINSNVTVSITLYDNDCGYVQIVGDATRDITIIVPHTVYLTCGASEIPFTCQCAYSNLGSTDVNVAKMSAVEISSGVTVITVPMLQRTLGAPAPPPTPAHGGYSAPTATAYLFLYGTLGPVGNVAAGTYIGTINVYVNYTTY